MFQTAILTTLLCVVLNTFQQIAFTLSGRQANQRLQWMMTGILFHAVWIFAWLALLKIVPLSMASPLMGASYITVALVSVLLFNEKLNRTCWIGMALIILGLYFLGAQGA